LLFVEKRKKEKGSKTTIPPQIRSLFQKFRQSFLINELLDGAFFLAM
jgi:hypothetical protein